MQWLTKMMGIFRIKWVPYLVFSWVASVGGVSLYSYMKGKEQAEQKAAQRLVTALEAQMHELERVRGADLKTVVRTLASEQELKNDIGTIEFPEIDPDCEHTLHDWLRSFNEAVNTVPFDTPGTD